MIPSIATIILLCNILSRVSSLSVTVFGGTGFAGSRVCKLLVDKGAKVTSISKSGSVPKWCAGEEWTKKVEWKSADLLSSQDAALDSVVGNPDACVSCVGVVGKFSDISTWCLFGIISWFWLEFRDIIVMTMN